MRFLFFFLLQDTICEKLLASLFAKCLNGMRGRSPHNQSHVSYIFVRSLTSCIFGNHCYSTSFTKDL